MKKRITALILSMAMAASFAACSKDDDKDETTAETTDSVIETEGDEFPEPDPRGADFEGTWGCGRCTIDISGEDAGYKVHITWSSSAYEYADWMYSCMYDESIDGLSGFGTYSVVTYEDENSEPVIEEISSDEDATFIINDDGTLTWNDNILDMGADMAFVKIDVVPSAIDPDSLTDWYFNAVTSHHSGTAGYSLGMAEAAYNVYHEAAMNDLSAVDSETLSANLLEAWEGLSTDDQATFDENILYIANLITSAQEDWEANKGPFEDAGVDTLMIDVLNMDGADEDWSALLGHTLTIGNG